MTRNTYHVSRNIIAILIVGFFPLVANAAEMYFGAASPEVGVGRQFEVGVFLNTEEDTINAIEAAVTFPPDRVELKQIRDGNSVVSLWIEKPKLASSGMVTFAGILPGGYAGPQARLFSIVFEAKEPGGFVIGSRNETVLLHDGLGTPVTVTRAPITLTAVAPTTTLPEYQPPSDSDPPEPFTPIITRSPDAFDGKWVVIFATQDKGSGIDHYEVAEKRHFPFRFWAVDTKSLPWVVTESPYVLEDQELKSTVYVKAVDRAGNERLAVVAPTNVPYETYALWGMLGLLVLILFFAFIFFILKRKRRDKLR